MFNANVTVRLTVHVIHMYSTQHKRWHQLNGKQEAISQKEIVFRFRKDIESEKGWRFDILCMRSPGLKGICADALLWDSLSCQSLRFVVEARYSTEPIQWEKEELQINSSFLPITHFEMYLFVIDTYLCPRIERSTPLYGYNRASDISRGRGAANFK